ncbi:hypothetical protein CCP2SC5_10081 [Azospirillaceae bacterium]
MEHSTFRPWLEKLADLVEAPLVQLRKKVQKKAVFMLVVGGISSLCFTVTAKTEELHLFSYPQPPMTYEKNGFLEGPLVRLVQETLKGVEISRKPIATPVARLLLEVESGQGVGFPLSRNSEREPHFKWIIELYKDSFGFATLHPNPRIDTLEQGRTLGSITVNNGSAPLNFLKAAGQFENLDIAYSELQNGLKLFTKRVDAWFTVRTLFRPIARLSDFDSTQVIIGAPIYITSVWMIGSKNIHQSQIETIQKNFEELKSSGIYDMIMRESLDIERTAQKTSPSISR